MLAQCILAGALLFSGVQSQQGSDMSDEDFRTYAMQHGIWGQTMGQMLYDYTPAAAAGGACVLMVGGSKNVAVSAAIANSLKKFLEHRFECWRDYVTNYVRGDFQHDYLQKWDYGLNWEDYKKYERNFKGSCAPGN